MTRELYFDDAVKFACKCLKKAKKPAFAAVYGMPNNGKSYFIDTVAHALRADDMIVRAMHSWPHEYIFESANERTCPHVVLMHCGIERVLRT